MKRFFKALFADPAKKKIFLITLISVLVLAAVIVGIVLGGRSDNGEDGSFSKKDQSVSTEASGNSGITTPSISITPDAERGSTSSVEVGAIDTTPGYGSLIRP